MKKNNTTILDLLSIEMMKISMHEERGTVEHRYFFLIFFKKSGVLYLSTKMLC
ncbi:hypothetical protein [Defluviitoga tunisiensis]|uniref:hypothetical protein n=1 Tax=Defluviitoga tunisiensis TaxID=1006576 RepID=UPI0005C4166C|nr:hypothetical protein [Defluviitoga tunisiensis]HHV01703.1 hypothetical protein [Defluviitoga tunisiensis]